MAEDCDYGPVRTLAFVFVVFRRVKIGVQFWNLSVDWSVPVSRVDPSLHSI